MTRDEARATYRAWLDDNRDNPALLATSARVGRLLAAGGDRA